jgi:S1-C subfamily serine protease
MFVHVLVGIEYTREFGEGPFKMEIRDCIVNKVMAGGEGERLGVVPGSRVLKVNDEKVFGDMELGIAIKSAKR